MGRHLSSLPFPAVSLYGRRHTVAECARCGRVRPLLGRGLCNPCRWMSRRNGTILDYGYVKADRVADYARLRGLGYELEDAAVRVGVSKRTAERYEAQLRDAGMAPWRQWDVRRYAARLKAQRGDEAA